MMESCDWSILWRFGSLDIDLVFFSFRFFEVLYEATTVKKPRRQESVRRYGHRLQKIFLEPMAAVDKKKMTHSQQKKTVITHTDHVILNK